MIFYAHVPKLNTETGMAPHACFHFRGKKKEIAQKKEKKSTVTYLCFLITHKFLCKISFKVISFFVSVVTLCDILYFRFKRFLALMFFGFFLQNGF